MLFVVIWCQNQHNRKHHHTNNDQQIQSYQQSPHQLSNYSQRHTFKAPSSQYEEENNFKSKNMQQLLQLQSTSFDTSETYQHNFQMCRHQQHNQQQAYALSTQQQKNPKRFKNKCRKSYHHRLKSLLYIIVILLGFIRPSVSMPRDTDNDQNRGELKSFFFYNILKEVIEVIKNFWMFNRS